MSIADFQSFSFAYVRKIVIHVLMEGVSTLVSSEKKKRAFLVSPYASAAFIRQT